MIRFAKNIFQTAWKFCTQIKNKLILYIKNRILKSIQTFLSNHIFEQNASKQPVCRQNSDSLQL
ncbi:hypothetical protein BV913_01645 [Neisseria dumasiana]|uniref:Uncharacterized protein n=1 Tax=Neisseria dumasiana TaxID=1931275 RepID=A0ABX3WNQ2_9NEIS|nr:hypothetical protein BV913_01645 [Neisseria dumasiana]